MAARPNMLTFQQLSAPSPVCHTSIFDNKGLKRPSIPPSIPPHTSIFENKGLTRENRDQRSEIEEKRS
jgi:hypothetical protein